MTAATTLAMPLREGEWRLSIPGLDLTWGTPQTPVWNLTTPDLGDVSVRVSDADRPRQDGVMFGIDFRSGRTISFEMGVRARTSAGVRDEAALLARAWRADPVRLTPGAVAEMHMNYSGRHRVVMGRPRRFAASYADVAHNNFVTVTADFACIDDLFYSPGYESVEFGIVPPSGGGLLAPLSTPLSTTLSSDRSQAIRVDTEHPVWPIVEIHGPVTNPVVTIPGVLEFEVRLSLDYDETVVIDTSPWARTALRNGYANVAGAVRGTRLSKAAIPAGNHEVGMRGEDLTGTARVRLSWRSAYGSP